MGLSIGVGLNGSEVGVVTAYYVKCLCFKADVY